jgi:hypothetical protein
LAKECYADLHVDCSEFLRHKQTVIRPDLLAVRPCAVLQWPVCCSVIAQPKSSVRVDFAWQDEGFGVGRTVQHMHDFVVTMPGAYHTGFNCGHARSLARSLSPRSLAHLSQLSYSLHLNVRCSTNCAEAVNFCFESWLAYGRASTYVPLCSAVPCRAAPVRAPPSETLLCLPQLL